MAACAALAAFSPIAESPERAATVSPPQAVPRDSEPNQALAADIGAAAAADISKLPAAEQPLVRPPASDAEVLRLVEDRRLWGRGLGWIDAHLLASALLSNCQFWTLDTRLAREAAELGLS